MFTIQFKCSFRCKSPLLPQIFSWKSATYVRGILQNVTLSEEALLAAYPTLPTLEASLESNWAWRIPQPFPDDDMWVGKYNFLSPWLGLSDVCPSHPLQRPPKHRPPGAHSGNARLVGFLPLLSSHPCTVTGVSRAYLPSKLLVIKPWLEGLLLDDPKLGQWPQIWHQTEIQELSSYA